MAATTNEISAFDPNEGFTEGGVKWPVVDHAYSVEDYANFFMKTVPSSLEQFAKSVSSEIKKGATLPPDMQSFATFSLMPEQHAGGVVQVPGIPFAALRKISRENLAPIAILSLRCADVKRYSMLSSHPWKPGWRIELNRMLRTPNKQDKKDIAEAEQFLLNCSTETDPRKRDARQITNFAMFLQMLTHDTLVYDGMSIWTDMALDGKVKAFRCLSTFNIRLATRDGYKNDPANFAVAVDEAGNIIDVFTRDQLVWYTRNSRPDADVNGYGNPEIEQAVRLIQGFTNAVDSAVDVFNRNAVPNGILTAHGMWTQRQLDLLSRIWRNLKVGTTKSWALPVIPVPKDGKLDLMDLTSLNGNDIRQQDFMNMMMGLFCAVYKFPVSRLGYRTSGKGPENNPDPRTSSAGLVDENDPGLAPLLQDIEHVINEYILRTRWPHLQFRFTGKNPREDAREYEMRANSMTWGERRAATDLNKAEEISEDPEQKLVAKLMDMCPVDPSLSGVYQNIAAAYIKAKLGEGAGGQDEASPEARFSSKRDPAKSLDHGHMAGVRRDSAAEEASANST